MKRIWKFLLICATTLIIFIVASCSKGNNVTGTMSIETTATTMLITASVDDTEGVVNNKSVRAQYAIVDSEGKEGSYSNVSFTKIPEKDDNGELITETQTVSNLKMDSTYKVKLYCTIGTEIKYLDEKTVKTSTAGQNPEQAIKISTKEELLAMKDDNDAYYELANDIDLGNEAISPIFTSSTMFKGHLDGKDFTIKGFNQTVSSQYEGLFGYIAEGAEVKNLKIENPTIKVSRGGTASFGVIAGYNNGVIRNVSVQGGTTEFSLTTTSTTALQYAGGLVGENDVKGLIVASSYDGSVKVDIKSRASVGGLVGYNQGFIGFSHYKGDLTMDLNSTSSSTEVLTYDLGGLVGETSGHIVNSYAEGSVNATYTINATNTSRNEKLSNNIGGFAGTITAGSVQNSVANVDINYKSFQASIMNIGLFAGLVSTNLNGIEAIRQNTSVLKNNTIKLNLLEKDTDWQITVKKTEDDEKTTTSAETTSSTNTKKIDRIVNFGFVNFLKNEDSSNTKFENDFLAAKNYFLDGTTTLTLDTVDGEKITALPYTVAIPENGVESYEKFVELGQNIIDYLAGLNN